MTLYEQDPDGPCARIVPALATRGYLLRITPSTRCPYVALDRPFEQYAAERSRQFRKRLRAARRKLEQRGELRATRLCDEAQVREALKRYGVLETRSWKHGNDAALGPLHERFLAALLARVGPKGALQVLELCVGGRLVASTIALLHERHYYSLHIVHDAEWSDCAPGNVLTWLELEECHAKGYAEFDFLGTCVESKLHWTSSVRDTVDIVLTRRSPRQWWVQLWKVRLAPAVRGALARRGLLERMQNAQRKVWRRLWGVSGA
jgi:CelD/BcsL family acetyltransferase involved in cellulose biosynthesis